MVSEVRLGGGGRICEVARQGYALGCVLTVYLDRQKTDLILRDCIFVSGVELVIKQVIRTTRSYYDEGMEDFYVQLCQ